MVKKFKVVSAKRSNRLPVHLRLIGDFDSTSAYELADILRKYTATDPSVAIDTDGLASINAFGLDVFNTQFKLLRKDTTKVDFIGRFKNVFAEE